MHINLSIPLLAGLCAICSYTQALPETEVKRWSEDIDSYQQLLEVKHINLYHSVSREAFAAELRELKESLPELNDQQLLVGMMRVNRLVGDGHTQFAWWEAHLDFFPFRFLNIDGEFRLVASDVEHRHLLGRKLQAIGGTPIEEIVSRLAKLVGDPPGVGVQPDVLIEADWESYRMEMDKPWGGCKNVNTIPWPPPVPDGPESSGK